MDWERDQAPGTSSTKLAIATVIPTLSAARALAAALSALVAPTRWTSCNSGLRSTSIPHPHGSTTSRKSGNRRADQGPDDRRHHTPRYEFPDSSARSRHSRRCGAQRLARGGPRNRHERGSLDRVSVRPGQRERTVTLDFAHFRSIGGSAALATANPRDFERFREFGLALL